MEYEDVDEVSLYELEEASQAESDEEAYYSMREFKVASKIKTMQSVDAPLAPVPAHIKRVVLPKLSMKLPRPKVPEYFRKCLLTYTKVNGVAAWTLWDSGSTSSGITPQFAHIAKITVFDLEDPFLVQLGFAGSRSLVQFGTNTIVKAGNTESTEYLDVANFDRYDMVIGTPYMYKHNVKLDFENRQVIVRGEQIDATIVAPPDQDQRIRRSRMVPRDQLPPKLK